VKRRAKPQVIATNQFSPALQGRDTTNAQINPEYNSIPRIPFIQRFRVLLAKPAKPRLKILLLSQTCEGSKASGNQGRKFPFAMANLGGTVCQIASPAMKKASRKSGKSRVWTH
jgi:hypothetical protein